MYVEVGIEAGDLYGATHLWDKTIRPKPVQSEAAREEDVWINKNELTLMK